MLTESLSLESLVYLVGAQSIIVTGRANRVSIFFVKSTTTSIAIVGGSKLLDSEWREACHACWPILDVATKCKLL